MSFLLRSFPFGLLLTVLGCAHSYYYTPEIAGDGAMSSKGGIVYSIPVGAPHYKMKVASLGIADDSVSSHFRKKRENSPLENVLFKKNRWTTVKTQSFIESKR